MSEKIYEIVNERIISLLEKGVAPWRMPWKTKKILAGRNLITKKPYTGCNFFSVNVQGYTSPFWGTYNQIQSKGGNVRQGEKGTPIIFWTTFSSKDQKEGEKAKEIPFLKMSYVFNLEQCENMKIEQEEDFQPKEHNSIESCENIISNYPLGMSEILHEGQRACYNFNLDIIKMPPKGLFENIEDYYHTLFHESVHATGHKSRLNRSLNEIHAFGDPVYSHEELIAEMGASYLSAFSGIDCKIIDNSASYLSHWLHALRKDNKFLIRAASQAQKAVNFLTQAQKSEQIEG
jgi:antirestriction protein ArdC